MTYTRHEAIEAAAKALWDTDPNLSAKSPWGTNEGVMRGGIRRAGVMVAAYEAALGGDDDAVEEREKELDRVFRAGREFQAKHPGAALGGEGEPLRNEKIARALGLTEAIAGHSRARDGAGISDLANEIVTLLRAALAGQPEAQERLPKTVICIECREEGRVQPVEHRFGAWVCPEHHDRGHVEAVAALPGDTTQLGSAGARPKDSGGKLGDDTSAQEEREAMHAAMGDLPPWFLLPGRVTAETQRVHARANYDALTHFWQRARTPQDVKSQPPPLVIEQTLTPEELADWRANLSNPETWRKLKTTAETMLAELDK